MKTLLTLAGMLTATAAFSGTTSEPPRDPRIFGDHQRGHMMQPCGPGYSVGHYPAGRNPQDFCGGDGKPRASGGQRKDPVPPTHPRPPKPPKDREPPKDRKDKGDNSDANGRGGNKHNRNDFTHGGTERAENRKGNK